MRKGEARISGEKGGARTGKICEQQKMIQTLQARINRSSEATPPEAACTHTITQ
jgi:hypothetical protein